MPVSKTSINEAKTPYLLWTVEEHVYNEVTALWMIKEHKQAPVNEPRPLLKQN